jgi:3-phenylpropionate/cinnamic acid dioxygenase small subunit
MSSTQGAEGRVGRTSVERGSEAFTYDAVPPRPVVENSLAFLLLAKQIDAFYAYEADLLDQWRYAEWLNLVTDDIRYWAPLRRNVRYGDWERERTKELSELAWFDENKTILELRVKQLLTGLHWAEEPLSRMTHVISNIAITEVRPSIAAAHEILVRSRMVVYRNHLEDEENVFFGKKEDILRFVGSELKIARRTILLDQSVLLAKNLNFIF